MTSTCINIFHSPSIIVFHLKNKERKFFFETNKTDRKKEIKCATHLSSLSVFLLSFVYLLHVYSLGQIIGLKTYICL